MFQNITFQLNGLSVFNISVGSESLLVWSMFGCAVFVPVMTLILAVATGRHRESRAGVAAHPPQASILAPGQHYKTNIHPANSNNINHYLSQQVCPKQVDHLHLVRSN